MFRLTTSGPSTPASNPSTAAASSAERTKSNFSSSRVSSKSNNLLTATPRQPHAMPRNFVQQSPDPAHRKPRDRSTIHSVPRSHPGQKDCSTIPPDYDPRAKQQGLAQYAKQQGLAQCA